MARNVISDLGAVYSFGLTAHETNSYSTLHALMNASFTLQGLLIFFGALLVRRRFPARALTRAAFLLLELSGLTLCIVGLAPEDVNGLAHVLAAAVHFVSGSLAMLLLGIPLLKTNQVAGFLSAAAGTIALAATLLLGCRQTAVWSSLGWPIGTVERVAAYPLPLWLSGMGLALLTRELTSRDAKEPHP